MIGFTFKSVGPQFFDAAKVIREVDQATRRVLSRFGAYVRRTARQSIRKRKKISEPGKPPSLHEGFLKRGILFAYDPWRKSVVIGPVESKRVSGRMAGDETPVPALLEEGGFARRRIGGTARRRGPSTGRVVMAHYRPRPFMAPAFKREQTKLPAMWANSIR